jgi:Ca2+/Na+ antiporter
VASPLPLVAFAADGRISRLDGGVLVPWFAVALTGLAQSGRALLAAGEPHSRSGPGIPLLAGLGLLTIGGDLLGRGLRDVVARFEVSGTLLGNTVVAASVEGEEVARVFAPPHRRSHVP